jgi:hypothetical protein
LSALLDAAAIAFGYRLVSTLPLGTLGVFAYWRESRALSALPPGARPEA